MLLLGLKGVDEELKELQGERTLFNQFHSRAISSVCSSLLPTDSCCVLEEANKGPVTAAHFIIYENTQRTAVSPGARVLSKFYFGMFWWLSVFFVSSFTSSSCVIKAQVPSRFFLKTLTHLGKLLPKNINVLSGIKDMKEWKSAHYWPRWTCVLTAQVWLVPVRRHYSLSPCVFFCLFFLFCLRSESEPQPLAKKKQDPCLCPVTFTDWPSMSHRRW